MHNSLKETTVKPYSKLALIYDSIMSHVNYDLWAQFITAVLKKLKINSGYLLDISCGTGSFLSIFDYGKFKIFASDYSLDMIKIAKKKIKVPMICADMVNFTSRTKFDVILCLYDSINYIYDELELKNALKNVYYILKTGGIFIFDISTESNSIKFFHNYEESGNIDHFSYLRISKYKTSERIQINSFMINDKIYKKKYIENHFQKIYKLKDITHYLKKLNFNILFVMDEFTFNKGSEKSDRIHFVVQK